MELEEKIELCKYKLICSVLNKENIDINAEYYNYSQLINSTIENKEVTLKLLNYAILITENESCLLKLNKDTKEYEEIEILNFEKIISKA